MRTAAIISLSVLIGVAVTPQVRNVTDHVGNYPLLSIELPKEIENATQDVSVGIADTFIAPPPKTPAENESYAWNYLRNAGFTRNQTAGIMANLQQEHGFKTSDVPGGLGIAQWIGNRRSNLLAKENPYAIQTQLDFLMEELHSTENAAYIAIQASESVEAATIAFQDKFERCGICRQDQRIRYGYMFLDRY